MKVKDLFWALKDFDGDEDVYFEVDNSFYALERIWKDGNGDVTIDSNG